jgi:hypothetical protein
MVNGLERLDTTALNFTDLTLNHEGTTLSADFGSGYVAAAVVNLSVREWSLSGDVLLDTEEHMIDAGEYGPQTRARYLFNFYERHMDAGRRPFWVRVPFEHRDYLVEFAEERMTFDIFTGVLFSAGLTIRQRRVSGVSSPADVTDVVNPDSI